MYLFALFSLSLLLFYPISKDLLSKIYLAWKVVSSSYLLIFELSLYPYWLTHPLSAHQPLHYFLSIQSIPLSDVSTLQLSTHSSHVHLVITFSSYRTAKIMPISFTTSPRPLSINHSQFCYRYWFIHSLSSNHLPQTKWKVRERNVSVGDRRCILVFVLW